MKSNKRIFSVFELILNKISSITHSLSISSLITKTINENVTEILCEQIPNDLNYFEKRKWLNYKEKLLFTTRNFTRFFVNNYCVWLYTNQRVRSKKWAIFEKVRSLKLCVMDVRESEIWILDDGNQKICMALLNGILINFKLLNEFSNQVLENFIQYMKKYSFESPKVRLFGSCFDFAYETEIYTRECIESKVGLPIDRIQYKYDQKLIRLLRVGLINMATLCFFGSISFSFYMENEKLYSKIQEISQKIYVIKEQMSHYPDIEHVKNLSNNAQDKVDLVSFVKDITKYINTQYSIKFTSKHEIEINIGALTDEQQQDIREIGKKNGIIRMHFVV